MGLPTQPSESAVKRRRIHDARKVTLRPTNDPRKVWLQHRAGEGGEFDAAAARAAKANHTLDAYFWENF